MIKYVFAIVLAFVLTFTSSPAAAACTSVSGAGQASDTVCLDSPLGLCTTGTLDGQLSGTYHGAFQSLTPAPTLLLPLRLAFSLDTSITSSTGVLYAHETGYLVLNDTVGALTCIVGCVTAPAPDVCLLGCVAAYGRTTFTQNLVPYAGTGSFSAIDSGLVVFSGYGDYTSGVSYATYAGQICE